MLLAYDSLILGSGSAGLSTALALGRLHRTCAVISNSSFRDPGLQPIHGVLGHEGKTADEIRCSGRKEVESYGHVKFVDATITKVYKEYSETASSNVFVVESEAGNRWIGRTLVVASGSKNVFPKLPGFVENWPANIYQCLICDGHEREHLPKGVLAYPRMTPLAFEIATIAHYLSMAPSSRPDTRLPTSRSRVTIFANGPANPDNDADIARGLDTMKGYGIAVDERQVQKLVRDPEEGVYVHLLDSEPVFMGFLFYKPVTEPADITQKVISQFGMETITSEIGTGIAVKSSTANTNTPGLFVAGDAGSTAGNESNAIHSGVMAAAGVAYFVNQLDSTRARALWLNSQNGENQNGEGQCV